MKGLSLTQIAKDKGKPYNEFILFKHSRHGSSLLRRVPKKRRSHHQFRLLGQACLTGSQTESVLVIPCPQWANLVNDP